MFSVQFHVSFLIQFLYFSTAGTTGAVLTCPLEVVKTRLQSSVSSSFIHVNVRSALRMLPSQQVVTISTCSHNCQVNNDNVLDNKKYRLSQSQLVNCLRQGSVYSINVPLTVGTSRILIGHWLNNRVQYQGFLFCSWVAMLAKCIYPFRIVLFSFKSQ